MLLKLSELCEGSLPEGVHWASARIWTLQPSPHCTAKVPVPLPQSYRPPNSIHTLTPTACCTQPTLHSISHTFTWPQAWWVNLMSPSSIKTSTFYRWQKWYWIRLSLSCNNFRILWFVLCVYILSGLDHRCQDRIRSGVIISAALRLSSFVASVPEVLRAFRGFIWPFQ